MDENKIAIIQISGEVTNRFLKKTHKWFNVEEKLGSLLIFFSNCKDKVVNVVLFSCVFVYKYEYYI